MLIASINYYYIHSIRSGSTIMGKAPIADKWYAMIADKIGFKIQKSYWQPKEIAQLLRIIPTLEDAKKFGYIRIIIGETGCGKTYVSDLFAKKHPSVKVGSSDNLGGFLDKIIDAMKVTTGRTKSKKIRDIIKYVQALKNEGHETKVFCE